MTASTNRVYIKPNSTTQTRRRFLITPLGGPVLDDSSKQTFSQNSLHSLAGDKNLKTLDSYIQHLWSDSDKCLLSWIVGQVHPLSPKKTKSVLPVQHIKMSSQSNNSSLRQFLPERILTSSKAAHSAATNVFCGDQSKIARLNENWSLIDRLNFVAPLVTFHKLLFNHKLFHWTHMKKNGYFVFVH